MFPLSFFLNRHIGQEGLLVGTGPSLDQALKKNWGQIPRILVNHAAQVFTGIADLTYLIYLDDQERYDPGWRYRIPSSIYEFVPRQVHSIFGSRRFVNMEPERERVCVFERRTGPAWRKADAAICAAANVLYEFCGTAMTAAHLAFVMGFRKLILIGMDGGPGRSAMIDYRFTSREAPQYDRINAGARALLAEKKIEVELFKAD